jgi:hypothetical protein
MQTLVVGQMSRWALSQGLPVEVLNRCVRGQAVAELGRRQRLTCEKRVLTTVGVTAKPTDVVLSLILIAAVGYVGAA